MAITFTNIASNTLTTNTTTVTFSSIPQTYTDLVLLVSGRSTLSANFGRLTGVFNGQTTYSTIFGQGNGSTTTASNTTGQTQFNPVALTGATTGSDIFSSAEIYIPSYTNSSLPKICQVFTRTENNGSQAFLNFGSILTSFNDAVSSITLTTETNSFTAKSSFFLYGIKNS